MRKLISILVTLGVVLGLTLVAAAPVAADVTAATVVVDPGCEGKSSSYNITFNVTSSLTEGVHEICILFPDGTVIPEPVPDNAVTVNGMGVPTEDVHVNGLEVCIVVPQHCSIGAVSVFFSHITGPPEWNIVDPPKGIHHVYVSTTRAADATAVKSLPYTIKPAISEYKFVFDFSPTYPGIAEDFIPPFKACGQVGYGWNDTATGFWYTMFNSTLTTDVLGCLGYSNVTINFTLMSAPTGATVTLMLLDPPTTWHTFVLNATNPDGSWGPPGGFPLAANYTETTPAKIHFDTVGDYVICHSVISATAPPCLPPGSEVIVERCMEIYAHQWKDAGKIVLDEKWNLISLPLVPFDEDIGALLESLDPEALDDDGVADLISIWHYDRCLDVPEEQKWSMYEGGGLTKLTPDNSYWVRMSYPMAGNYTWWVWGTARAMPPDAPLAYNMCPGWNMFGYTELSDDLFQNYLWNLDGLPNEPLVYGWTNTGDWTTSGWLIRNTGDNLFTGQGYWGYFLAAGQIVPP